MFNRTKRNWHRLLHSKPGRRFQNYYRRSHRKKNSDELAPRVGRLVLASVLFVIAACLFLFPLVYVPFLVAGAAMFASESHRLARMLDHGEVWMREHWARAQQRFGHRTTRVAVIFFSMGCLAFIGRACYNTFMR